MNCLRDVLTLGMLTDRVIPLYLENFSWGVGEYNKPCLNDLCSREITSQRHNGNVQSTTHKSHFKTISHQTWIRHILSQELKWPLERNHHCFHRAKQNIRHAFTQQQTGSMEHLMDTNLIKSLPIFSYKASQLYIRRHHN